MSTSRTGCDYHLLDEKSEADESEDNAEETISDLHENMDLIHVIQYIQNALSCWPQYPASAKPANFTEGLSLLVFPLSLLSLSIGTLGAPFFANKQILMAVIGSALVVHLSTYGFMGCSPLASWERETSHRIYFILLAAYLLMYTCGKISSPGDYPMSNVQPSPVTTALTATLTVARTLTTTTTVTATATATATMAAANNVSCINLPDRIWDVLGAVIERQGVVSRGTGELLVEEVDDDGIMKVEDDGIMEVEDDGTTEVGEDEVVDNIEKANKAAAPRRGRGRPRKEVHGIRKVAK